MGQELEHMLLLWSDYIKLCMINLCCGNNNVMNILNPSPCPPPLPPHTHTHTPPPPPFPILCVEEVFDLVITDYLGLFGLRDSQHFYMYKVTMTTSLISYFMYLLLFSVRFECWIHLGRSLCVSCRCDDPLTVLSMLD